MTKFITQKDEVCSICWDELPRGSFAILVDDRVVCAECTEYPDEEEN